MKAPCHECTRRTVIPNCHSTCEEYKLYQADKELIRAKRNASTNADDARIARAVKRKSSFYKQRRK